MPSKVFLGPNLNFWCKNCNIPIIELKKCPNCQSLLEKLKITPPFEITPAFEKDLHLIRKIIDNQYGKGVGIQLIPPNKVILLNKAPYYDRMDEVIVDGFVLGNIRFNPAYMQWEFIPKIEGARRLIKLTPKKWIQVDEGAIAPIAKGANVLAPGVVDFDPDFKEGDSIIVINSNKEAIATGLAKYAAKNLINIKRGMVVKTKDHGFPKEPQIKPAGQDWDDVIKANTQIIKNRETQAKKFIKRIVKKYKDLPVAVSFSGGKDSLCLLLLVIEAIGPTDIFFIDTGIEFKETIDFTNDIIEEFGLSNRFTYKKSKESFWENLDKFGPPARDYRWCCKVIKLANVTELLNERYQGKKVVTFIGVRQYESASRHQDKKVWTNYFLPQQIGVSPIHKWPSLHIWLYLFYKKVRVNPLYQEGYKRIGCIYCPATKLSDLLLLKELHPDLYNKWMDYLKKWAIKYNLSHVWAERGFWRNRRFKERGQINLANEMGISEDKITWQKEEKLKIHVTQGINPCQDGSFSIEGRVEGYFELGNIVNQLGILGLVKHSKVLSVISLRTEYFSFNLFSDGTFTIRGNKLETEVNFELIVALIKRANECNGCGLCITSCLKKAIGLKNQRVWVNHKLCNGCKVCLEKCPVLKYDH